MDEKLLFHRTGIAQEINDDQFAAPSDNRCALSAVFSDGRNYQHLSRISFLMKMLYLTVKTFDYHSF